MTGLVVNMTITAVLWNQMLLQISHIYFYLTGDIFKITQKSPNILATFSKRIVAKIFNKSPNLVTLFLT